MHAGSTYPSLGSVYYPENLFPFASQVFLGGWHLEKECRKVLQEKLLAAAGTSSQSCSLGWPATGSWDLSPGPLGLTKVPDLLAGLPKTETEQMGSAACCNKSQTCETGAGARGKRFIQVPATTCENGGLPSQRSSHLSAQAHGSYRDTERRAFFFFF